MNFYGKNNRKEIVLVALLVAIVGMSLGFAAFSNTLSISSSASVTPNSSDFNIRFCNAYDLSACNNSSEVLWVMPLSETNGASGKTATLGGQSINGLTVNFTGANQSVEYAFFIQNAGEYDAYLKDISYTALSNGIYKMCSATTTDSTKATDSLVQVACDGINVTISVGGTSYTFGSNISGHKLSKGAVEEVNVKIEYTAGSALADGPFKVDISDFKLNYSTVDNNVKLISFVVDSTTYQSEEGMTLAEWVNSSYNTGNFTINSEFCNSASGYYPVNNETAIIVDGVRYDDSCKDNS